MANTKRDYYDILGAPKGASEAELKSAYRKKAKEWHPDNNLDNHDEALVKMKEINEAYSVLGDAQKRAAYDQYGHAAFDQSAGGGGNPFGGFSSEMDFGDLFGGVFGDLFGGGGRRANRGPRRGRDVSMNIQIEFLESIFGANKELNVSLSEICDTCGGSGAKAGTHAETCKRCNGTGEERVQTQSMFGATIQIRECPACRGKGKVITDPCPSCNATGYVRQNKRIEVSIPKGIDDGQAISITGKGEPGEKGGVRGDLIINVRVRRNPKFVREGLYIYSDLSISFITASLGGEVAIPTPYGDEKYTIGAGTQPETRITLRGKGAPNVRNPKQVGDLVITVKVNIPTRLTDRQKELLRQFDDDGGNGDASGAGKKKNGIFGKK